MYATIPSEHLHFSPSTTCKHDIETRLTALTVNGKGRRKRNEVNCVNCKRKGEEKEKLG